MDAWMFLIARSDASRSVKTPLCSLTHFAPGPDSVRG